MTTEPTFDVFATCGDPNNSTLGLMVQALQVISTADTVHTGQGVWEGVPEYSATLAWFGVSAQEADFLRRTTTTVGRRFQQEAMGFIQIPSGSALIDTRP